MTLPTTAPTFDLLLLSLLVDLLVGIAEKGGNNEPVEVLDSETVDGTGARTSG